MTVEDKNIIIPKKYDKETITSTADLYTEDFVCMMKELRVNKNLTLKDIENRTGIDYRALSKYETGARIPRLDAVFKYLLSLGASIDVYEDVIPNLDTWDIIKGITGDNTEVTNDEGVQA